MIPGASTWPQWNGKNVLNFRNVHIYLDRYGRKAKHFIQGSFLIVLLPIGEYLAYMETPPIISDELQNFSLCPAPKVAQQGGIFIMPHLL